MGDYTAETLSLLEESIVVDLLATPCIGAAVTARMFGAPPRVLPEERDELRASRIDVMHFAQGIRGERAHDRVLLTIAAVHRLLVHNHRDFVPILSVRDIDEAHASRRTGLLIGVQNAEHFRSVEDVVLFAGLGQRIAQLTYNERNPLGAGCSAEPDDGLSEFGRKVVDAMNAEGMAIDLSHCGPRTTREAIDRSSRPVLVTHSNCRALNDNPRCKSDEEIRALAARGGVFGVSFFGEFVSKKDPASIDDLVDHVVYLADLVGVAHVAVGSDMDLHGYDATPEYQERRSKLREIGHPKYRERWDIPGLDHPRRMFDFVQGLLERGFEASEVRGILGSNARDVLAEIWGETAQTDGPC